MKKFILILLCLFIFPISAQPIFKVEPISGNINTEFQEFGPSISKDGLELYFYSKRKGANYTDLYKAIRKENKWSIPMPLEELNSPYDDGSPFIFENKSSKSILFSSNRDGSKEFIFPNGKIGVSRDIYFSDFKNNVWTEPKSLSGRINTSAIEENPFLSGNTLYFTRYPFGELQKAKIYSSVYDGRNWSEPKPLPFPINDDSSNIAAIVSDDGKEILFSSNREKGYGGYDIYRAKIHSDNNITIENLGPEINTVGDEAYIIQNHSNNSFIFCRKEPGKSYDIYEGTEISEKDISEMLKIRNKITLNNIYFERNSSKILAESEPALDKVVEFLRKNPDKKVKITGHTDLTGDLDANKILSENRAIAVKEYMIQKKIDSNRIFTEGKGSSLPLINSDDDFASKKNRRTEFEILK
ncbi:MAG: OmpA family protein [Leptospiraceae bacterium]|nr:OmpA family protein [Leptospiraceae bacterium]MCK6381487.1 OmpA family protein [Leptospiraceae bacterium]